MPLSANGPIMVHELAHQWFGNTLAPEQWSDLWLNGGSRTWYEWLYGAELFLTDEPGYDFVPRVPGGLLARRSVAQAVRAAPNAARAFERTMRKH